MEKKQKKLNSNNNLLITIIITIIVVIVMLIILNLVRQSRKEKTINSANEYKDAINKNFIPQILNNDNTELDEFYTVNNKGLLVGELEEYNISISGTKPIGGYLTIENDEISDGCLTIGNYKALLKKDTLQIEKGKCEVKAFDVGEEVYFNKFKHA